MLWISPLNHEPPPVTSVPTLVLGHPGMTLQREPEVFIPLAVPGVHRAGAVHRGDGVALLPLAGLIENSLPNSGDVFARLLGLLEQAKRPC